MKYFVEFFFLETCLLRAPWYNKFLSPSLYIHEYAYDTRASGVVPYIILLEIDLEEGLFWLRGGLIVFSNRTLGSLSSSLLENVPQHLIMHLHL